jgi:hypothetical protein
MQALPSRNAAHPELLPRATNSTENNNVVHRTKYELPSCDLFPFTSTLMS